MALTVGGPSLVRRIQVAREDTACSFLPRLSFRQVTNALFPCQFQARYRGHLSVVASFPESRSAPSESAPKKITIKKGDIVRVDKEQYLNSVEYLAVGHPPHFKGLDYIYEDRGEILDVRVFDTGEYALLSWAGIPTSPAWLPTYMLIKSEKLSYKRT